MVESEIPEELKLKALPSNGSVRQQITKAVEQFELGISQSSEIQVKVAGNGQFKGQDKIILPAHQEGDPGTEEVYNWRTVNQCEVRYCSILVAVQSDEAGLRIEIGSQIE